MKIGILDSGVGGLGLLKKLDERLSGVEFVYYGDNENAPYGNCSVYRLRVLVRCVLDCLLAKEVDCVVIACNTVSCTLFKFCEEYLPIKVFGVFPPVETAVLKYDKPLLLCTRLTANDYLHYDNLLEIVSLRGTADEIEKDPFNKNFLNFDKKFCKNKAVILGCTHYFFKKLGIIDHFCPMEVYDGVDNTILKIIEWYNIKNRKKKSNKNSYINNFIFLGPSGYKNAEVFRKLKKC